MSWARREPGDPVAEAIWESLEIVPAIAITRDDVLGLGKDPELVARFDDTLFGLGDDAYVATLDIQHKIHCLNELRKMAFADYGEDAPEKKVHGQMWWIHLRHCTDMLAQDIMCHADADLVTYNWVDSQSSPFPDFSINRKCRDFRTLFEFVDERSVDSDKYERLMKKPKDAQQIPNEPGYYAKVSQLRGGKQP